MEEGARRRLPFMPGTMLGVFVFIALVTVELDRTAMPCYVTRAAANRAKSKTRRAPIQGLSRLVIYSMPVRSGRGIGGS